MFSSRQTTSHKQDEVQPAGLDSCFVTLHWRSSSLLKWPSVPHRRHSRQRVHSNYAAKAKLLFLAFKFKMHRFTSWHNLGSLPKLPHIPRRNHYIPVRFCCSIIIPQQQKNSKLFFQTGGNLLLYSIL